MNWLEALRRNRRRGSYPRCLLFMHSDRRAVAERLTGLVGLPDVQVREEDFWMPQGLPVPAADGGWDRSPIQEAQLGRDEDLLPAPLRTEVANWWLAVLSGRPTTPNWDIACTATIEGRNGLILVEAKAHSGEMDPKGKSRNNESNLQNHERIAAAIQDANDGLNSILPGWCLSRDSHYQLANRFAWSWKMASLGVPVVLVYLGFLRAEEMSDQGLPFADAEEWERTVKDHSRGTVPETAWNQRLLVRGIPLWPLLRTREVLIAA